MSDSGGNDSTFDDSAATSERRVAGDDPDAPATDDLTDRGGRETDPITGDAISADDPADDPAVAGDDAERDIDDSGLTDEDNAEGGIPKTWP